MSEYKEKYFHLKADFELYKSSTRKCDEVFTQQAGVICRKTFEKAILEQQLKETQEKLEIAVSALEFINREMYTTEYLEKRFELETIARQALEKIGNLPNK